MKCGLTDCDGLVKSKGALRKLEDLHLRFIQDWREPIETAEAAGLRLGQQLLEGFSGMPVLIQLTLEFFHGDTSFPAWSVFARGPALPMLEQLILRNCKISVHDWAEFIGKHIPALIDLHFDKLHLYDGFKSDIGSVFDALSRAPKLEDYDQSSLFIGKDKRIRFPSAICYPITRYDTVDDGYVLVHLTDWIRWKGPELKNILVQMAKHLEFTV